jgi:hypothetical protein
MSMDAYSSKNAEAPLEFCGLFDLLEFGRLISVIYFLIFVVIPIYTIMKDNISSYKKRRLKNIAAYYRILLHTAVYCRILPHISAYCRILPYIAACANAKDNISGCKYAALKEC